MRQVLVEQLEEAGYATLQAGDGRAGLDAIIREAPDLVICDIRMPVMDGHQLLAELRRDHHEYDDVPFIFLSGLDDKADVISGIRSGADEYLTKPIDLDMLIVKVETALRLTERLRNMHWASGSVISRAIDAVDSAMVITESWSRDLAVIYANPAFETLTGYTRDEVIGRNCRFLQGEGTDPEARSQLRFGLQNNAPTRVVIRNYRKDGLPFWNELCISPILNRKGEATHFVGCQNAVPTPGSSLLQREALDRVASLSKRERQVFEKLVHGYTTKEIALALDLSPRTVEKHRLSMQAKMGTNKLALLVRYAIAIGLLFVTPDG